MFAGTLGVFHVTNTTRLQELGFLVLSLLLIALANFIQGMEDK